MGLLNRLFAVTIAAVLAIATILPGSALAALSQNEQTLLNKLAQGSAAEVELGKLVESKATQESVRSFAKRMVKDHTMLLHNVQRFAKATTSTLNSKPGEEEEALLKKISSLFGAQFGETYIAGMLDDHKKDVQEVAMFIDKNPNSELAPLLKQTLPVLEDHLRIAENVAGKIGLGPQKGLTHP